MIRNVLPEADLPPFDPSAWSESATQPGPPISTEDGGQVTSLAHWGRGLIYGVDISPDGSRIAVNTSTGIGLYDAQTMDEIYFLEMATDYRNLGFYDPGIYPQLDFSGDGQVLAIVVGSEVHLLDAKDGTPVSILAGEGENYQLMSIAFSADGKLMAGSEGWSADLNIWNAADGELLQSWQETPAYRLTFSPDGQLLVSSNGEVHNTSDGSLLYSLGEPGYGVNQAAFSADGKYLSANEGMEGRLGVWRTSDGELLTMLDEYASAVFLPAGEQLLLVTSSGEVQTISLPGGSLVSNTQIDNPEFINERMLSFTPDGWRLVTAASGGIISLWDLSNGQMVYRLKAHFGEARSAKFSADGEIMVTTDDFWVCSWRTSDGTPLESLRQGFSIPLMSPDASTLVNELYSSWNGMQVWNAGDGSLRYVMEDARWPVAFSADSSLMATGERFIGSPTWITDTITVRQVSDGSSLLQLRDGDTEFDTLTYDLAFSPDGSILAGVVDPGDLLIWKLPEGELLYRINGADHFPFVNVAISPDGQVLATGNDYHKVFIWDAADGELIQTLPMESTQVMGDSGQVSSLAFSPDGTLLAATDEGGFYQIWEVEDWTTVQHNSDFVNQMWRPSVAMAFSPDGTILAIGGTGNAISLWRVSDGFLLKTLTGTADDITRIGFSPDGRWMYSGSLDGALQFWGVPPDG